MKDIQRVKVAYVCHFSSPYLQSKLPLRLTLKDKLVLALKRKPLNTEVSQSAVWNDNAISEIKNHIADVDFHVIIPYPYLDKQIVEWEEEGISYHVFRDNSFFLSFIQRNIFKKLRLKHKKNRAAIRNIVNSIKPDIIHVVGAENPYYSLCVLDMPNGIPVILQLQTLLSEEGFEKKYIMSHDQYIYRSQIEKDVILRADYIGTSVQHFIDIIKAHIKPQAKFVDITLAVAEPINENNEERTQDFVYFAKDIAKAADWAVEAFALAHHQHPEIHLTLVGGYTPGYKQQLDDRIVQLGIKDAVRFTGMLPTHEDVIKEVRKSKYALLPIKADLITGTIREAMAAGVPVITNVTPGTPLLNKERESVLLAEPGDFKGMADSMCRLIEDKALYSLIQDNAITTVRDRYNNCDAITHLIDCYKRITNVKAH